MSNFSSQNSTIISDKTNSAIPEPIPSEDMTPEAARAWLDANLEWAMGSDEDELDDEEFEDED